MSTLRFFFLSVSVGFFGTAPVGFAQIEYTVREVRPVGAIRATVTGINAQGDVVGSFETDTIKQAFVDRGGVVTLLPPLPGYVGTVASGINERGQVAGSSIDGGGFFQACRWTDGLPLNIGPLAGGRDSSGSGINAAGDFVGSGRTASGAQHAFYYADGAAAPLDLGTLGGEVSSAAAVNADGTVVGRARIASGETRAFSYRNGSPMRDLGTLGGNYSEACGINAAGDIVGEARLPDGKNRAFRLSPGGVMTDLGVPAGGTFSVARAINARGEIVGVANNASRTQLAFHLAAGRLRDLNLLVSLPGGTLDDAVAINDAGQIAVRGRLNGTNTGFVLTPIPPAPVAAAPVVEVRGKRRLATARPRIVLRGTATGPVSSVEVRARGRSLPVIGAAQWSCRVRLRPGRTVLTVVAQGAGLNSVPMRVVIVRR